MPDVIDRLISAVNAHDQGALMECYVPGAVAVWPEMQAEGWDEIIAFQGHIVEGFPDMRVTVWDKMVCDDNVVVEGTVTGTHTGPFLLAEGEVLQATGRSVSVRCCWVFTVEHDLVVSQRGYYDQLECYSHLGLRLPAPE
ncbi:hypothetical protein Psi02_37210 [Planotetraspora silvatica]|uniref:SnoaL-like domain-containing protein n=1 Tax=Planotetraspora silvatica TaxID=234614 RepID=A0A8J3ULN5_9ACTN|nr:nuclear transport factor 2 family protein [Planotetraspora silvatica]GII47297.1 hypothetical protein Psi02_37210 [Planotetraspora silvatica]